MSIFHDLPFIISRIHSTPLRLELISITPLVAHYQSCYTFPAPTAPSKISARIGDCDSPFFKGSGVSPCQNPKKQKNLLKSADLHFVYFHPCRFLKFGCEILIRISRTNRSFSHRIDGQCTPCGSNYTLLWLQLSTSLQSLPDLGPFLIPAFQPGLHLASNGKPQCFRLGNRILTHQVHDYTSTRLHLFFSLRESIYISPLNSHWRKVRRTFLAKGVPSVFLDLHHSLECALSLPRIGQVHGVDFLQPVIEFI